MTQTRRAFLRRATASTAGIVAAGWLSPVRAAEASKGFEISLAEWSLHKMLGRGATKEIDNLDFAQYTKEKFGINAIEYVSQFFPDKAQDSAYLAELNKRASDHGVKQLLIMIDREGNLGDPNDAARTKAVENHYKWVDAAKTLGCHSIRVNAGSAGTWDEQLALAADGLSRLAEYGSKAGINVIVENNGGLSSNGEWLAAVIKKVDSPYCGTLPDFGNFRVKEGEIYDPYKGVEQLMPFAKGVSVKTYDFVEGEPYKSKHSGWNLTLDYKKLLTIVKESGYQGYYGIEYEGNAVSEVEGIMKSKQMLEQLRSELFG